MLAPWEEEHMLAGMLMEQLMVSFNYWETLLRTSQFYPKEVCESVLSTNAIRHYATFISCTVIWSIPYCYNLLVYDICIKLIIWMKKNYFILFYFIFKVCLHKKPKGSCRWDSYFCIYYGSSYKHSFSYIKNFRIYLRYFFKC